MPDFVTSEGGTSIPQEVRQRRRDFAVMWGGSIGGTAAVAGWIYLWCWLIPAWGGAVALVSMIAVGMFASWRWLLA